MDMQDLLIADRWRTASDAFNAATAKNINNLTNYINAKETNPHYNEKRAEGMKYNIQVSENFIDATDDLLEAQSNLLQQAEIMKTQLRILKERYETLRLYASEKGCDLELFQYMNKSDFKSRY